MDQQSGDGSRLAATIPSGNPSVVQLREDLASLLSCPTRYPMVPANWTTPFINISTIERPWPSNYIYIGHGPRGSGFNPSPWGPPFCTSSISTNCPYDSRFVAYAYSRAVPARWWLQGETLDYFKTGPFASQFHSCKSCSFV